MLADDSICTVDLLYAYWHRAQHEWLPKCVLTICSVLCSWSFECSQAGGSDRRSYVWKGEGRTFPGAKVSEALFCLCQLVKPM